MHYLYTLYRRKHYSFPTNQKMYEDMSTYYYWDENREEIYRSAPARARSRTRRQRRGRGPRRREPRVSAVECLSHGDQWRERLDGLVAGLAGRLLPGRRDIQDLLSAVVCSCEDRDRESTRGASASFGYTSSPNLPLGMLQERMHVTSLYFHNILNAPEFTQEYLDSATGDPLIQLVRGLYDVKEAIFHLIERQIHHKDFKAYRLLNIIRQYILRPCQGHFHLHLKEMSLDEILSPKNGHVTEVSRSVGCYITANVIEEHRDGHSIDLFVHAANMIDLKTVESYFTSPIGFKEEETGQEEPAPTDGAKTGESHATDESGTGAGTKTVSHGEANVTENLTETEASQKETPENTDMQSGNNESQNQLESR